MRIDPPMSVPSSKVDMPVATAAAGPPDDPPDVRVGSHGFRVAPNRELNVWMSPDHSGTLVLPNTMAPAERRRPTAGASALGIWSARAVEPPVDRRPATSMASLIVIGSPCSGPGGPPAVGRSAAWD